MNDDDIEQHLKDMGLLPAGEAYREKLVSDNLTYEKDYFNDPRDENGEVPY